METLNLSVPTVHCRSCKLNIEESLDELDGVAGSDVDLDAKAVTITYDPTAVQPAAIAAAIEEAGYPVAV
jgi:copper chaperone CopZ